MAHTTLMQRLLQLTKTAKNADKKDIEVTEFASETMFTRRKFLENSTKATLAATILASCNKAIDYKNTNENNGYSIAIIGAGIAGLNAAFNLKNAGVKSTVYEAGNRTGGRMFTAQNILNSGLSTELGGEFIDSGHYDMRMLAAQFNLPVLDLYSAEELTLEQNIYYINGISYTDKDFLKAIKYYLPLIQRDAAKLSDVIKYNNHSSADAHFDKMNIEQYFDSIGLTGWLRSLLLVAYLGEYGLNTDECNAINFLFLFGKSPQGNIALYGESDERMKISGGNQKVTDALHNELKDQIRLDHKLLKIESNSQGYRLHFENANNVVKADIVLLALPFTLLRHVEINVDMPGVKQRSIQNLSYGNNSKLVFGFDKKPWRDIYKSVGMCYADNGVQNCWDNSQLQPGTAGGLTVYLGGDDAVKLGNGDINNQGTTYLKKLSQVYPGIETDFNNKVYRMVWSQYPLSKSSYSAWKVGQYTTIAGAEGETVGNMFFAGEHTSYAFQGFMNGGAASGRIAAEKILKKIGR